MRKFQKIGKFWTLAGRRVVCFFGKQELSFRGHNEGIYSKNKFCFILDCFILDLNLLAIEESDTKDHLKNISVWSLTLKKKSEYVLYV